ncbi:MAG: phosphate ABC transporter permease subunit PstC [Rhodobacterales bacterium]|nr:phosphate ABC transporter permease subunit PstC [Rhodobacterales bacterium]
MSTYGVLGLLFLIAIFGFFFGRIKALSSADGDIKKLHSLPQFYGLNAVFLAFFPPLLVLVIWTFAQSIFVDERIKRELSPWVLAEQSFRNWLVIIGSIIGLVWALTQAKLNFRARPRVEQMILVLLAAAATLAIFTSVGIVLSMLFEALRFFGMHPWTDFFFGSTWAPSFSAGSELSILPLLWGTLYISFVALLVAVPIGLYAAIYLSEYASRPVRAFAKPLLEVLAGIPTIVYGLFALTTFGPFLRKFFGDGGFLGVEWMSDSRSVITAGVVMGMMLIPFVSSLSDDIINAVPQSLRDGSYGLGATQSETVRNVILPAALPGIIGAILLAASRAIGETMIVVLGAGAVAKFAGNPLEALTTITTRIVSQLTGDLEFDSAETLVAFALGLTLFTITLGLNVLALYIVRRYREQYE